MSHEDTPCRCGTIMTQQSTLTGECGGVECPQKNLSTHPHSFKCPDCGWKLCPECGVEQIFFVKRNEMANKIARNMKRDKMSFAKSGILHKKGMGKMYRPWAKRNFVLQEDHTLKYFDNDELKGELDIIGAVVRMLHTSEADGRPFAFEIANATVKKGGSLILRGDTLQLAADNFYEEAEWAAALKIASLEKVDESRGSVVDSEVPVHVPSIPAASTGAASINESESENTEKLEAESTQAQAAHSVVDAAEKSEQAAAAITAGVLVRKKTIAENTYRKRFIWIDTSDMTFHWSKNTSKEGKSKSLPISSVVSFRLRLPQKSLSSMASLDGQCVTIKFVSEAAAGFDIVFNDKEEAELWLEAVNQLLPTNETA